MKTLFLKFLFVLCMIFHTACAQLNDTDQLPEFDPSFLMELLQNETDVLEIIDGDTILPPNLNDSCLLLSDSHKTYHFDCLIDKNHSNVWDFAKIRRWIESSDFEFKFDVRCLEAAEIGLQWPVKASNILHVTVKHCTIGGIFMDYGNTAVDNLPDHLQVLELRHSAVMIRITDLMHLITNFMNLTEDYNCGNDKTLKRLVYKNITYTFDEGLGDSINDKEAMSSANNMIANTRTVDHRCTFNNLELLDQSISKTKSRYFMSLQIELSTFPKLVTYNISDTGMTDISKEFKTWWRFFPKLQIVDLSNNLISEIDLDHTATLWEDYNMTINLTNNNITVLSSADLELLASISNVYVDIRNNPINCVCSRRMRGALEIIKDDKKWDAMGLHRYDYIRHMKCASPVDLKGKQLVDLNESDLLCPIFEASSIVPIIILSVFIVILIVIIIVLTKFRKEIFILTYTRFHIILPCQPADVTDNKKYDAFVSYSNHDEEWVSKTFKDLESSSSTDNFHQFRFCLHHRDFIPGKTIFDNVIDSVESSRHTVIILSKHFLQSHYCMYEFHEAFQQSIIERKRHMIVVLMEPIPEEELPSDLKRCLKTFTYIRKEDSIFTDRLIYAMSHKARKDSSSSSKTSYSNGTLNPTFTCEKDTSPGLQTSRPRHDDSVVTLSQIIPDLVVGHNESKSNGYTIA